MAFTSSLALMKDGVLARASTKDGDLQTNNQPFPEGATVYLKSGSPPLTVEVTRSDQIVAVTWFDGTTLKRDGFHKDALTTDAAKAARAE